MSRYIVKTTNPWYVPEESGRSVSSTVAPRVKAVYR